MAVLDTNVFLEVHSCKDLRQEVDRLHAVLGDAALQDPVVTLRVARARESALLAIYLSKIGAPTYSLRGEAIRQLLVHAPPNADDSLETRFTTIFAHFINDRVLRGWKNQFAQREETEVGDAADLLLIEYAANHKIPIITHEGYTAGGIVDNNKRNMRARCKARGVQVFAPREFYAGKIDEKAEIEAFLQRFWREARRWLDGGARSDATSTDLSWVFGYYRLILNGEVAVQEATIPVSLF